VALAEGALRALGADRLLVLVVENPGHKPTVLDPATRLELARLAFADLPNTDVRLDDHAYTVDLLRDQPFEDAVLVIGADQWAEFDTTWKEPEAVRRLIPIAVATRPGRPVPAGDVEVFEIEQHPVASSEIRERIARGEPIDELVPAGVSREIARRGLYGRNPS
jgi:nicotinate-nucleotide adenylyltransferase